MKKVTILLFALLCLFSCNEETKVSKIIVDAGFSSYVNAFTSGVISSNSNIKVILAQPFDKAIAGEMLKENIFNFEPEIKGNAYWLDNQTVEFRPENHLPSGQSFKATFNLSELIAVSEAFKKLEFGFVVITQSLFVSFDGIKTNGKDFLQQELFGTIRTSDDVNPAQLEECLTAEQEGKTLDISWTHEEGSKTHQYTVKDVQREMGKSTVTLSWNGAQINADVQDDLEIEIPPMGEFSLMQINAVQSPGLYFSIQFSDPVDPNQDLSGLITLRNGSKLRYSISDNEIKAYPLLKVNSVEIVIVDKAVKNIKGKSLEVQYEKKVLFNLVKPAVELIGDGVIIPNVDNASFPFKAINLKAVNIRVLRIFEHNIVQFFQGNHYNGSSELSRVGRLVYDDVIDLVSNEAIDYGVWNSFNVDLSRIIEPEPGAIYRVMISFEQYQSLYPCADSTAQMAPMKRSTLNFDDRGYFDEDSWFEGDYNYRDIDDPCSPSYYLYYDRSISANIFSSNFGIISKASANNNHTVTITDLRTTDPISGVTVEAYNYQNVKIGEAKTNGDGVAQLHTDGKPYLMVAKEGLQRGYLRVDKGSALSVSLYEVGGAKIEKGVKGYIYGERGVWRPGDTLFLSFMLEDKLNTLPESHPIIMELYDPMGKLYDKKVKTRGVEGLYSFKFKTSPQAETGKWRVKAIVGNATFTKRLKVETIKPNRIKVDYDFNEVISSRDDIKTTLKAKWLYGSPAANLKINSEMNVSVIKTSFDKYEGYSFDDRSANFSYQDPIITESKTNAEGTAKLNYQWNKPESAPGMLKLTFNTKIFEQGGDFSQDFLSKKYSPFESYVGVKLEKGSNWLTAIDTEEDQRIGIATVDEYGKAISRDVKVELYKMRWNWWWEGDGENELTQYINRRSNDLIMSDNFTVSEGKSFYDLSFPRPGWGKYLVRIIDTESGHSTSQIFFGKYSSWYNDNSGGDNSAASALSIETDKEDYNVGEPIEVTIPSGGIGNIYVTIEKGDKILDQLWVKATENSSSFTINATEEMAPNVYINAVLLQPHAQEKNSLPIRMYGVIPVSVFDKATKLEPVIETPKVLQPEKSFTVKVSEKTGNPMAYTIAVVDEGLLSLTRFKTPNAWSTFYAKEALSIKTWDMYKYVMSAHTGKMAPLLAIGGDEGLNFKDDAEANRFKPVVTYLGPFFLDKGDKAKHSVHIPNYIGAVRVMVVAGYEGAYGSAEKELEVKQPLMVLSTLPRVLGPSEKIKIPINIITMDDNIKKVKVKITTNDLLRPLDISSQTVNFDQQGEQTIYFDYEVARKLGVAKFKVELSSGKEKAFEELEIKVRAPNPEITMSEAKELQAGTSWQYDYKSVGIEGSNSSSFQISSIPDLNLKENLDYLIRYPHGCIEQTTSGIFPQLFLESFVTLSDKEKENIQKNIIAGLNKFKTFQISSGGFGYWPGANYASEWGTNYAGHFMIEAKNKGYDLPPGLYENWLKFQKGAAGEWTRSKYFNYGRYGGDLMQAYRLYTLALAGHEDVGAMNRLRNDLKLSDIAAWRLASAYAVIGREDVALDLCKRDRNIEPYRSMGYSYGSHVRDMAIILETMSYTNNRTEGLSIINTIAADLKSSRHSTQTRAYALLAIAKYIGGAEQGANFSAEVKVNGKTIKVESEDPVWSVDIEDDYIHSGTVEIKNNSTRILFVSLTQTGTPVELNQVPAANGFEMKVAYTDLKGNALDVKALQQGQDFKAKITLKHSGLKNEYKEVALNQIFPSGWQIINTRVGEDVDQETTHNFTYQDIRDDRVYTYFDINRGATKQFEVLLNATFAGRYYMPAIFCAPMYDESIQALKPGQWVEVLQAEE